MENRLAPKSCTFYGSRMRRDAVMPRFHDTKIDRRLELLLNSTALLCIVRVQNWAKNLAKANSIVSRDKEAKSVA